MAATDWISEFRGWFHKLPLKFGAQCNVVRGGLEAQRSCRELDMPLGNVDQTVKRVERVVTAGRWQRGSCSTKGSMRYSSVLRCRGRAQGRA